MAGLLLAFGLYITSFFPLSPSRFSLFYGSFVPWSRDALRLLHYTRVLRRMDVLSKLDRHPRDISADHTRSDVVRDYRD